MSVCVSMCVSMCVSASLISTSAVCYKRTVISAELGPRPLLENKGETESCTAMFGVLFLSYISHVRMEKFI